MNLILLLITVAAVAILISESTTVKNFYDQVRRYFTSEDKGISFLSGIDNTEMSQEEISEFKDYLMKLE